MGKSTSTYRELLEHLESDWKEFRRPLRKDEKKAYDRLFNKAKKHVSAAQYQARPDPMESFFMSVLLEQQMEIQRLKAKLDGQLEVDSFE